MEFKEQFEKGKVGKERERRESWQEEMERKWKEEREREEVRERQEREREGSRNGKIK